MEGRRVEDNNVEAIDGDGDYSVQINEEGEITGLWFSLPGVPVEWARIAATGHSLDGEPGWTITEGSDGKITVDPSIDCKWGSTDEARWHGWLREGDWSVAA
jgi:hypothetical protein